MKLSTFETVILAAAFFSMIFSIVMWFVDANELTAIFIGLWVPSILAFGTFLRFRSMDGK